MLPEKGAKGHWKSTVVCGRRFCCICKRWRLLVDFPPHAWRDEEKTLIKYVQPECRVCRRALARAEYQRLTPSQKRRRTLSSRTWHRRDRRQRGAREVGARVVGSAKPGSVRREPFAEWLREKVARHDARYVARRIGLPERRIHSIINGYEMSGKNLASKSKRKLRPVDHVRLDTVDKALQSWGEPPSKLDEMYPLS